MSRLKWAIRTLVPGLFLCLAGLLAADDVAISGIDARYLALSGQVDIYAVASDKDGRILENLNADDFRLRDAADGDGFDRYLPITGFSPAGEQRNGISFLLLMDDSGSMYNRTDGRAAADWEETRAALVRKEAASFLRDLGASDDRAGLAEFGTSFRLLKSPRTDRVSLNRELEEQEPPENDEAYTELFASIHEAAGAMAEQKGRRIVILFSDGENFPYLEYQGLPHPEYGTRVWTPDDALKSLQQDAVTLYAVRFGPERDSELARIARATGGQVFDIDDEDALSGLYSAIRDRVRSEYRLSYRPGARNTDTTRVELSLVAGGGNAELSYPSGLLFGEAADGLPVLLSLLSIPLAIVILIVLLRLRAAEEADGPSLDRLRPVAGAAATVALSPGKTVISPGLSGGGTVILAEGEQEKKSSSGPAGRKTPSGRTEKSGGTASRRGKASNPPEPSTRGIPAAAGSSGSTIIVEKGSDGRWHAAAEGGLVVNNRNVESTILENGDVIRAGEELIVFDDGSR